MVASWLVPEHMAEERELERELVDGIFKRAHFFLRESFKSERVS